MPEIQVVGTAPQAQLRRAGQEPNRGWPAYEVMYPMGGPEIISGNYRNLVATHGRVAGAPMEPHAEACILAGAERVDAWDFRALDSNSA